MNKSHIKPHLPFLLHALPQYLCQASMTPRKLFYRQRWEPHWIPENIFDTTKTASAKRHYQHERRGACKTILQGIRRAQNVVLVLTLLCIMYAWWMNQNQLCTPMTDKLSSSNSPPPPSIPTTTNPHKHKHAHTQSLSLPPRGGPPSYTHISAHTHTHTH